MAQQALLPTRKWFATQITATAALLVAFVSAGAWDKTLTISLIGLVTQAMIGYLLPNATPADGAPAAGRSPRAHAARPAAG